MMGRYTDAYRVANAVVGIADTIKILSIALGVIVLLVGGGAADLVGKAGVVVGLFLGAVIAGGGFALATLLAAHGQVLKATLDTAVNTSPFLTNKQRAEIMSLS